ncbi:hypothetical protein N9C56_01070 [Paracoccaceae bacterium]|nr:hypothetical protein [Paracoccaceae bacterium]
MTAEEILSGPAQRVEDNPPSMAKAFVTEPWLAETSSWIARYRLDLPLPLGPVMTFNRSSGSEIFLKERYPDTASVISIFYSAILFDGRVCSVWLTL